MQHYIGIDPGSQGGIAVLTALSSEIRDIAYSVQFFPLDAKKVTLNDIADFLMKAEATGVVIEKVGSNRVYGRAQGATGMFTFGKGVGFLLGVLTALQIPYVEVSPTKWQNGFSLKGPKDEAPTTKKNRHKQRAQELYPQVEKMTHWKADALLIATYCRRNYLSLF